MSALKLYLIEIDKVHYVQISIFRELHDIHDYWINENTKTKVGIIHAGFVRPFVNQDMIIKHDYFGKMFITGSLKWSLPPTHKTTIKSLFDITLDDKYTPCYLCLNNWGYENIEESNIPASNNYTIVEAAEIVIRDAGKSLNKEEIYALIVEGDLYRFGAKKPVSALNSVLNKNSINSKYKDTVSNPKFIKSFGDRFNLVGKSKQETKGWIKLLPDLYPDLFNKTQEFQIYNDEQYLFCRDELNIELANFLDLKRFEIIRETLGKNFEEYNFKKFINALPKSILENDIKSLDFTVRIKNIFKQNKINKVKDLTDYDYAKLIRLPNMGKKSVNDLIITLENTVNELTQINQYQKNPDLEIKTNNKTGIEYLSDQISESPLISHLERTFSSLPDKQRKILYLRLGYDGSVYTLQEVGERFGLTRERIRQIQKKYTKKIIRKKYWDDEIGARIGQLLIHRNEPLYLHFLEIEDPWFKGFDHNLIYLGNVIQIFSENYINVIEINSRKVITRINQNEWEDLVKRLKKDLKEKADDGTWSRGEIDLIFESSLVNYNAEELLPLLNEILNDFLGYDSPDEEAKLVSYGRTAQSAVATVLHQAESPLHYNEIAIRASKLLGTEVDVRRATSAALSSDAKLFGPSKVGLKSHNPLPDRLCESIKIIVEDILYKGPINKQWHSNEIIEELRSSNLNIPDDLDEYLLGIILDESGKLSYLNRMVWARSDSGLTSDDRIEVADAIVSILENTGHPLTGKEIRDKLSEIRGLSQYMQIYPTDRVISIGPNKWGLIEWKDDAT